MRGTHWFGAKVAKYVNLRAPGSNQELPPHEVFNNALTLAEAVGEKPSVELFKHIDNEYAEAKQKEKMAMHLIQFGAKIAQAQSAQELIDAAKDVKDEADASGKLVVKKLDSAKNKKTAASSCAPCDMPNGPTNKKHMTGASPAVLEADEASEAIKPKTTKTKHDKSVVTGKQARTKRAAGPVGLPPVNPAINIKLPSVHDVAKQTALFTAPIGAVVGGAIGGFGSKKDKLRNTLLGALKGTAVGAAGGAGTVYGGRYLPELIGNTTGMSAAVPSAVLAGGAGGGLLAGGLTSAGFDAIAGNNDEEEPKKQAQAFGRRVAKEIKRAFELGPAPAKNKGPAVSPYTADFLGGMPQRTFTPSELENELRQRTDSVYPQIQPRPTLNPKPENIFNYSGPRNSVDDFLDAYSSGSKAIINTIGKGLYQLPSSLYNMAGLAGDLSTNYTSATRGSVPSSYAYGMGPASASGQFKKPGTPAAKAETPAAPPAASSKPTADTSTGKPGMFDGIDARTALMYGLPIGLGGAGLYGLYNYLNSKPKKKTEDEKEKA
jgi:hypothetical protein